MIVPCSQAMAGVACIAKNISGPRAGSRSRNGDAETGVSAIGEFGQRNTLPRSLLNMTPRIVPRADKMADKDVYKHSL